MGITQMFHRLAGHLHLTMPSLPYLDERDRRDQRRQLESSAAAVHRADRLVEQWQRAREAELEWMRRRAEEGPTC